MFIRYPASHVHVPVSIPFIVGLLNSLVDALKALKIYVLLIISSRFLCHSVIQDLLIVGCEEETGSNFNSFVMLIGRSHTRQ